MGDLSSRSLGKISATRSEALMSFVWVYGLGFIGFRVLGFKLELCVCVCGEFCVWACLFDLGCPFVWPL